MKKMLMITMALFLVILSGCAIPAGVQSSLYTAQTTLDVTVKEASASTEGTIWHIPTDATNEQKLAARESQVILLIQTMEQANKNLEAVIDYFRTRKETK